MKIRYKITLWIAAAGVLVSLVLSIIVFLEMLEQPYDLLDGEIDYEARIVIQRVEKTQASGIVKQISLKLPPILEGNFIRIYDHQGNVLFQSSIASRIKLPPENHREGSYTINTSIPISRIRPANASDDPQDDTDQLAIRMKVISFSINGHPAVLQIGKLIEKLDEEITDLIWVLGSGLFIAAVLLLLLGYGVAGKILQPINTINRLAREINDKTLGQRIPLGRSHDELYALSKSLNRMFDRLQHSFDRQKEFIANASHELKSPLTLLQLSTEELIREPELTSPMRSRLQRQLDTLHRMSRLIRNLLELSVLELKEGINIDRIELTEVIASVLEDFKPVFKKIKLAVLVDVPPHLEIEADRQKIRRVLVNLLENATRYNREGGHIELALKAMNSCCRLSLSNTGDGISEADIHRVFDQFYRVEKSRSLQHGGSGLGLTIVKRIVELHGGAISIQSEPHIWTRVIIELPFYQFSFTQG